MLGVITSHAWRGSHMMLAGNLTEMSERSKREKSRKLQRNFHTLMWVDPSRPENRESTFPSPLFLPCLPSLPTFSLCSDNRGHGETMQKGKAGGLCGSNMGVVWGAERGKTGERASELYGGESGESDGGFLFLGERVLMRGMYRESAGMRGVV